MNVNVETAWMHMKEAGFWLNRARHPEMHPVDAAAEVLQSAYRPIPNDSHPVTECHARGCDRNDRKYNDADAGKDYEARAPQDKPDEDVPRETTTVWSPRKDPDEGSWRSAVLSGCRLHHETIAELKREIEAKDATIESLECTIRYGVDRENKLGQTLAEQRRIVSSQEQCILALRAEISRLRTELAHGSEREAEGARMKADLQSWLGIHG